MVIFNGRWDWWRFEEKVLGPIFAVGFAASFILSLASLGYNVGYNKRRAEEEVTRNVDIRSYGDAHSRRLENIQTFADFLKRRYEDYSRKYRLNN